MLPLMLVLALTQPEADRPAASTPQAFVTQFCRAYIKRHSSGLFLQGSATSFQDCRDRGWIGARAPGNAQRGPDRYFKEDHLTGADYIRLAPDHTYRLIGREHMGVWILESGRWEQSADGIRFVPKDEKTKPYTGTEASHRGRTFVAFSEDAAPGIAIPTEEIKRRIDANPKTLPSYVFFEIDKPTYERDTKQTYPFRTKRVPRSAAR